MSDFKNAFFAVMLGLGAVPSSGMAATCADLALVLAIDGSGSINDRDFALQRGGYAAAFANPRVLEALAGAGVVDVAVVFWGDGEMSPQILPWRRVDDARDAAALAGDIAATPRRVTGDTGIGRGLWTALDLLEEGRACAARQVINVSGDGRESFGPRPRQTLGLTIARDRAEAMGVTVNGLAITTQDADISEWYRARVITGQDAFVLTANSFDAFGDAIVRKLVREIALPMVAQAGTRQERLQ
jgi:Protein of unknown function (DUF1194)